MLKEETKQEKKRRDVMEILYSYDMEELKSLFNIVVKIKVPADIFLENDKGYIKSNISKILTHYILKTFKNGFINLKDMFHKCEKCFCYYYFDSIEKNVCIICFRKEEGGFQERLLWRR